MYFYKAINGHITTIQTISLLLATVATTLVQAAKLLTYTTNPLLTPICIEILFFHQQYPYGMHFQIRLLALTLFCCLNVHY